MPKVTIHLSEEERKRLEYYAKYTHQSMSQAIRKAVLSYVKEYLDDEEERLKSIYCP